MRLTDAVIALPLLPLLIVLAAVDLSKLGVPASLAQSEAASLYRILLIVALVGWTTVARLVRGTTLSVRERDFVRAAVAQGAGPLRIMLRHILPNVVSPIIVATTLSVGNVILTESVLSFLGLGIQPPLPSWGNMLTNAQELIWQAPALAIYPGLLIFVTVIAFNFLGDGLQDALDPRAERAMRDRRRRHRASSAGDALQTVAQSSRMSCTACNDASTSPSFDAGTLRDAPSGRASGYASGGNCLA